VGGFLSDLNQIDDDMFEADKSTEFQGSDVQKIEHSPCDVVPIVQVAVELPQSSYGRGWRHGDAKREEFPQSNLGWKAWRYEEMEG
jgi:hypothetical protein